MSDDINGNLVFNFLKMWDIRKQIIELIEPWETFRNIPWFEWCYKVSDFWKVMTMWKNKSNFSKQKILKLWERRWYKKIMLYKNWVWKDFSVHKLVMLAFIWEDNWLQVNHIDWDKTNNRLENLEYLSASENMKHAYEIGIKKVPANNNFIMKKWNGRNKKIS